MQLSQGGGVKGCKRGKIRDLAENMIAGSRAFGPMNLKGNPTAVMTGKGGKTTLFPAVNKRRVAYS